MGGLWDDRGAVQELVTPLQWLMDKPKQLGAVVLVCLALSGCAPLILGRTPQPAAPDEWVFSLNAGYPLLSPYPNDPVNGPAQSPTAHPVNLFLARGVGGATELNGTVALSLYPTLRFGGKTLLTGGTFPVAADYGASVAPLPFVNGAFLQSFGFDAGLLFSLPQPGVEPYGGLRGFVSSSLGAPLLTGSLTVGADIPAGGGSFFVELTAATTAFDTFGNPAAPPLPSFGFTIVPALGYRF